MSAAFGAALGVAALLGGILLAVAGAVGGTGPAGPPSRLAEPLRRLVGLGLSASERRTRQVLLGVAATVFAIGWLYTGIPLAGIGAAIGVVSIPWLFGAGRAEARSVARLEAVEVWTRRLADIVRAGSGLHQAIVASAVDVPAPIAAEVAELAIELRGQLSTVDALRRFADRLGDASSDEVVAALILNARERGPRLADVLDRVSESMADTVTMRREQTAGRTDARISGMVLSGLVLLGLVILLVNKSYMAPYRSLTGEIVLGVCLAIFAGLLVWCRQLNMPRRLPRLLRAGPDRRPTP